ncbi:hypothetical protein C8R43DRAFT_1117712 [Mycena crocata]|nr:hypothetical protein C8R43DRAFT_1117712 [Mycena crocata]
MALKLKGGRPPVFNPNIIRGPQSLLLSTAERAARQARQQEFDRSRAAEAAAAREADATARAVDQLQRDIDLARRARRDAQRPAAVRPTPYRSPGATRVRPRSDRDGDREVRAEPLKHEDLLWLEREWTCPDCTTTMLRKPFRHYGEEAWLAGEYPGWKDASKVEYKWDGLKFPKYRKIIVIPDSP